MKSLRLLLCLAVLAIGLVPVVMHVAVWAPSLVRDGHIRMAVASIAGAGAWFALCVRLMPAWRRS